MPKDEQSKALTEKEVALDQEVELETRKFLEQTGRFPTRPELRQAIKGGSFGPICKSANRVENRLRAEQARMATLPDMPDDLRLQGETALKQFWATAKEHANADLADLRQAQRARDEDHRRLLAETEEVAAELERERDAEAARADAAEAWTKKLEDELAALHDENNALHARLDERQAIFAQLGIKIADRDDQAEPAEKGKAPGRPARAGKVDPAPEDQDRLI